MTSIIGKRSTGRVFGWTAVIVALASLAWAMPAHAQVHDNAGLFSDSAIRTANDNIQQMQSRAAGHTMLIETFDSVPADKQDALRRDKNAFFQQWAADRGKAEGVSGVVLLICMDPKHYELVVGNKTMQSGLFTDSDRRALGAKVRDALSAKNYDSALTVSTTAVLERYSAHRSSGQSSPSYSQTPVESSGNPTVSNPTYSNPTYSTPQNSSPRGPVATQSVNWVALVVVGIGVIVIFSFIIRIFGAMRSGSSGYNPNTPGYGQNPGNGNGGGGFGTGLLGGLLGGAAASWMANNAFGQNRDDSIHHPHSSDPGSSFDPGPTSSSSDFSGPDTSFSGGGDFGGGGDSGGGGGDSGGGGGGGDSGGGDF